MITVVWPHIEISRTVQSPPEQLWHVLTDTVCWRQWGPSILDVECAERFIRGGSRGRIRTVLGLWLPFVISTYDPGRFWSWHVSGVRATGHQAVPHSGGRCRVVFQIPLWAAPYLVVCQIALRRIQRLLEA